MALCPDKTTIYRKPYIGEHGNLQSDKNKVKKPVQFNRQMEWLEICPLLAQFRLLEAEMSTSPLWKAEGKPSGFVFPQLFPVLKGYWLLPCPLKETGNNLNLLCFHLTKNPLTRKFSLPVYLGREVPRHVVLLLCGQRWKGILLSELLKTSFLLAAGP